MQRSANSGGMTPKWPPLKGFELIIQTLRLLRAGPMKATSSALFCYYTNARLG